MKKTYPFKSIFKIETLNKSLILIALSVIIISFIGSLSGCATAPAPPNPPDITPLPEPELPFAGMRLYAVNDYVLYSIDAHNGNYTAINTGYWAGAVAMGQVHEHLYIAAYGVMWDAFKIEPTYFVTADNDWSGTEAMAYNRGMVQSDLNYVVKNGYLYSFIEGGASTARIVTSGLDQTTALTGVYPYDVLFSISHNKLMYIKTDGSAPEEVGNFNWEGTTAMTYVANSSDPLQGNLYIICKDILYRVNINSGIPTQVSAGWSGTRGMVSASWQTGGYVFVIQNGTLFRVNPATGARVQLGETGIWYAVKAFTCD